MLLGGPSRPARRKIAGRRASRFRERRPITPTWGEMEIEVSDPRTARDLVRFLRGRGYLAVERGRGVVEAVPIDAVGSAADRARTLRDVQAWAAEQGGVEIRPLEG